MFDSPSNIACIKKIQHLAAYSQIILYALELVGNLGLTSILKIGY